MTNFEKIGVNRQYDAETKEQANTEFDISCYTCTHCSRANWCSCHACQIRLAHDYMIAYLSDKEDAVNS